MAFYVGAKSSNVKTVVVYIGLFFLANLMKGQVVQHANKPYYTPLNNFGYENVVTVRDKGKWLKKGTNAKDVIVHQVGDDKKEQNNERSILPSHSDPVLIPLPPSVAESTHSSLKVHVRSSVSCSPQVVPALIPLPDSYSTVTNTSTSSLGHPSSDPRNYHYRVYTKLALCEIDAIGMFYYSKAHEWAMAAHAIYQVVQPHVR
jgi:hypothetical protein